jgi:hypothetical protein
MISILLYLLYIVILLLTIRQGFALIVFLLPSILVLAEFISGVQAYNAGIIKISLYFYLLVLFFSIVQGKINFKSNTPLIVFSFYVFLAVFFHQIYRNHGH